MECPKCGYLGFEETPRCRNCSYDFALAVPAGDLDFTDLDIVTGSATESGEVAPPQGAWPSAQPWALDHGGASAGSIVDVGELDALLQRAEADGLLEPVSVPVHSEGTLFAVPAPAPADVHSVAPSVTPAPMSSEWDVAVLPEDAPLVRLQRPRAPVSVRKTPMSPKLRAVSRLPMQEPSFDFLDPEADEPARPVVAGTADEPPVFNASPAVRRLAASAIDGVLFVGIDLAVLYFTFRIVGLTPAEWRIVPVWPLVAFLAAMQLVYGAVFTAMGGQTIGKMAAGIRVVSLDNRAVTGAVACRRSLTAFAALATAGVTFLPALFGDRRAIHDRLSGTRVVLVPAA